MFIIIINLTRACAVQGYSAHRVCLSICLSVTTLVGTTGTRQAELRYLQKVLDAGNNINVGF